MNIKKIFLIQTEIGHPDPWDDSLNSANIGINPGIGLSNNIFELKNTISFFQRVDNRFSISRSTHPDYHLVLKKPYSVNNFDNEIGLNFDTISDLLKNNIWKCGNATTEVVLMASILDENNKTQVDAISNTSFFIRDQEKIININTGKTYNNPRMIPWFFCYKTNDVPLYYIVMNPYSIQCIDTIDDIYDTNHIFTISNHLKNLNNVIFKPNFSRNTRVIGENNLIVTGDSFIVEPFGAWAVKTHFTNFFDDAKVKVDTNFNYIWEEKKIKVDTSSVKKGYFIIRWNTGTGMDLTFHTSKNRFFKDYVVDVVQ